MKHLKYTLAGVLALGSMTGFAFAQEQTTAIQPAVAAQQNYVDVPGAIDQINRAKDSSQVIDIYGRAIETAPDNVDLMKAYMRRLVDLDVPQFATPVAEKLVRVSPDNALAWAVIGVSDAKHDDMPDALANVAYAGVRSPDDPFIQKSAGQMLAWYDNAPQKPPLADGTKTQIERVRQAMANRDAYTAAYKDATDFYTKSQQANAVAPAQVPSAPPAPQAQAPVANQQPIYSYGSADNTAPSYPAPGYSSSSYSTPGYYAPSYAYPAYPAYSYSYPTYSYPYYYDTYPYYYPGIFFGGFSFGGRGHFDDFRFHGGGFHDGFHGSGHFEGHADIGHGSDHGGHHH